MTTDSMQSEVLVSVIRITDTKYFRMHAVNDHDSATHRQRSLLRAN